MSTDYKIIRKLYSDFQHADIDAILAQCAAPALSSAGTHRGQAAGGASFASLGANLTSTEFTLHNYVQDGHHFDTPAVARVLGRS